MTERKLRSQIKEIAQAAGASLLGFADVSDLADLPRAVVVAIRHSPEVFGRPEEMPTPAYYEEYIELNRRLDELVGEVGELLQSAGYTATRNAATVGALDLETLSAPFPHKTAATRAGLGWVGKCALLVTPGLGPALRLASLFTDAPLTVGEPIRGSQCGDCTICRDACPAGAVLGENWYAGRPRAEFYDAFACARIAKVRAQQRGIPSVVCGICMAVCPRRPR